MSKQELDDILKFGTEELFKDEATEGGKCLGVELKQGGGHLSPYLVGDCRHSADYSSTRKV